MTQPQLRPARPDDIAHFYDHESDPEARRRANFPPRDLATFTAHWENKILGNPTVRARAVLVDGELVGNVVAWWQEDRRYVGYWLARECWGRGIGTAALRLFLTEEAVRPLYADTDAGNTASAKLLERCGFRRVSAEGEPNLLLVLEGEGETDPGGGL
ncbi:MAG TPA: GNAT family N-acetyltransferase [Candidatus Limnocylindrales bacterium]|nr:GNAT family N-acetyltransferase [Candidatus Limnocylindrales bacterium]